MDEEGDETEDEVHDTNIALYSCSSSSNTFTDEVCEEEPAGIVVGLQRTENSWI